MAPTEGATVWGGVVCRRLDALTGWSRRVWVAATVTAVLAGLVAVAAGHVLAGSGWVVLAGAAWAVRVLVGSQVTEVGDGVVSLRGALGRRVITTGETRAVVVAHSELAAPRLVVHGAQSLGIAVPVDALARDAELADALARFVSAVRAARPAVTVDAEARRLLRIASPSSAW